MKNILLPVMVACIFFLINLVFLPVAALNMANTQIESNLPPGLPDFYVNDDWVGLDDDTIVIDYFIIDYIIGINAFASIQDALNEADSISTIFVFQGTYYENVYVRGDLFNVEIRGVYGWNDSDPQGQNIICGQSDEPVVKIQGDNIRLHGFIINNNAQNSDGVEDGGLFNCIYENTIKNVGGTGVVLTSSCSFSQVYNNNFMDNKINALDDSKLTDDDKPSSMWYNEEGKEGNYWDDHPGGLKRGNVWLEPYEISGSANSVDKYPWIKPDGASLKTSNPLFLEFMQQYVILYKLLKRVLQL